MTKQWTAELLTDDQIEKLRLEAAEAGDEEQQALCDRALAGEPGARAACAEAINEAEAQDNEREPRDECPTERAALPPGQPPLPRPALFGPEQGWGRGPGSLNPEMWIALLDIPGDRFFLIVAWNGEARRWYNVDGDLHSLILHDIVRRLVSRQAAREG